MRNHPARDFRAVAIFGCVSYIFSTQASGWSRVLNKCCTLYFFDEGPQASGWSRVLSKCCKLYFFNEGPTKSENEVCPSARVLYDRFFQRRSRVVSKCCKLYF